MEISQKTATGVRKYFYEYVVIALTIAVITLFSMYISMNKFITTELLKNSTQMVEALQRNSDILQIIKH